MNSTIPLLIAFFTLFTTLQSNAMDSIAVQIKVKHPAKFYNIKHKGDYSLTLFISDSTHIKLQKPTIRCIYIHDTLLSAGKSRIEVMPVNYFLSKYRVRKNHVTLSLATKDPVITLRYKRMRYGFSTLLIRLRLKQFHCPNSSVW